MKLYWCERTRAVRAVWMMEELGVPYERVRIDMNVSTELREVTEQVAKEQIETEGTPARH